MPLLDDVALDGEWFTLVCWVSFLLVCVLLMYIIPIIILTNNILVVLVNISDPWTQVISVIWYLCKLERGIELDTAPMITDFRKKSSVDKLVDNFTGRCVVRSIPMKWASCS